MEDDYICREFAKGEREAREARLRFRQRPTTASRPTVSGRERQGYSTRSQSKSRKTQKAAYAQCVADGICTKCRKIKADSRLCALCHEKEKERWKKRSTGLSERRAKRRDAA